MSTITKPIAMSQPTEKSRSQSASSVTSSEALKGPDTTSRSSATLAAGLLGAALLWLSLPPVEWSLLAWFAPAPWLWLISQPRLAGRRPYLALWCAGFCFWLASLEWLRHAHPAAAVGGVFLSIYLGAYLPVFVALCRVGCAQLGLPAALVAPAVWAGLELARAHLLTGFTLASLGHTQYRWLEFLQSAELGGAYLTSGLVMLAAVAIAELIFRPRRPATWVTAAVAAGTMLAVLAFGRARLAVEPVAQGPRVALVQGATKTEVKHDPGKRDEILRRYLQLSRQAIDEHPEAEFLVWPETMFRDALLTWRDDVSPPPEAEWDLSKLEQASRDVEEVLRRTAAQLERPAVLGLDVFDFGNGRYDLYNSAIELGARGEIGARYDKMHPVLFGEYVPLGSWFPWLYEIMPLPQGLTAGTRVEPFHLGRATAAVNICYELFVPHLLRRQVARMEADGQRVDWLINLTNNGYYGGSAELDLHLISGIFRAVELRRPVLVAANCGFSAWIDSRGRVRGVGPRQAEGIVLAQPELGGGGSIYQRFGDLPAGLCLAACVALAVAGLWRARAAAATQAS